MSLVDLIKGRFEAHCFRPLPIQELIAAVDVRIKELQAQFLMSQLESMSLHKLIQLRSEALDTLEPLPPKRRKAT